jgi:cytochrome c oxidase subunit 3
MGVEKMAQPVGTKPDVSKPAGSNGKNGNGDWDGGRSWGGGGEFPVPAARLGMWLLIAAIVVMFAGFTSAYIVRSGAQDWHSILLPPVLWFNTAALLLSSFTFHRALAGIKQGNGAALSRWLMATIVLGLVFLGGQLAAWGQLAKMGVFLQSNPASSFFYLLSAMHGLHLIGGVGFLGYVLVRALRNDFTKLEHLPVELCATYWHFMDGLWLYLFIFLFVVRPG